MKSPGILPLVCPSCAGTWFRLAGFGRYRPFTFVLLSLASPKTLTLLVCLCGRLQVPSLSGIQLPAAEREAMSLLAAINRAHEAGPAAAFERSRLAWQEHHANLAEFQELQRLVDALQYEIYVLRVSSGDAACFGRRRMRPKRSRQPDSHGRDPLVAALQSCGLTFRLAGRVIGEVVDIWKRALAAGHSIKLPIGRLLVRNQRIVFRPARQVFPIQLLPLLPEKSMPSKQKDQDVACVRCGGVWLSKQDFHRYAAGTYSQRVGGNLRLLVDARHVYVCLCGYPGAVSPLVRRNADSLDFHAAVKCAQQFVAVETVLKQSFAELANTAVTKTEMNTLRRRVASLESQIAWLAAKGTP